MEKELDAKVWAQPAEGDERIFYQDIRRIAFRKQINEHLLIDTHNKAFKKMVVSFSLGPLIEGKTPALTFIVYHKFVGSKGVQRYVATSKLDALDRYNAIDIRKRIA